MNSPVEKVERHQLDVVHEFSGSKTEVALGSRPPVEQCSKMLTALSTSQAGTCSRGAVVGCSSLIET